MDGTLVHTETEVQGENSSSLKWVVNYPFELVPKYLIDKFKDAYFNYDAFVKWSNVMNNLVNVWNIVQLKDNRVLIFIYGSFNPLESEMEVKRVLIDTDIYNLKDIIFSIINEVKALAKNLGIAYPYVVTKNPKALKRIANSTLEEAKVKILKEVI